MDILQIIKNREQALNNQIIEADAKLKALTKARDEIRDLSHMIERELRLEKNQIPSP